VPGRAEAAFISAFRAGDSFAAIILSFLLWCNLFILKGLRLRVGFTCIVFFSNFSRGGVVLGVTVCICLVVYDRRDGDSSLYTVGGVGIDSGFPGDWARDDFAFRLSLFLAKFLGMSLVANKTMVERLSGNTSEYYSLWF